MPLCRKAADFKSDVSTSFTTRAMWVNALTITQTKTASTTKLPRLPDEMWRRVPESNWTGRICNPLHNRFANAPLSPTSDRCDRRSKKREALASLFQNWSGKRVSNSRPQPWQGCALPTELFPRFEPRIIYRFFEAWQTLPINASPKTNLRWPPARHVASRFRRQRQRMQPPLRPTAASAFVRVRSPAPCRSTSPG
jgi:hypothetical protein